MPIAASLAQSESKKRFLDRLGLDERNKLHRQLYAAMKGEAVDGWGRISAKREALIPQLRNDPTVEAPYTFGQIDEEAVHDEVMYIFQNARKDTRIMYELGRDRDDGNHEENWIIRWLLWHVFRYRDDRNTGSSRKRNVADGDEADLAATDEAPSGSPVIEAATQAYNQAMAQTHDRHVPRQDLSHIAANATESADAHNSNRPQARYFDPVRDLFRT